MSLFLSSFLVTFIIVIIGGSFACSPLTPFQLSLPSLFALASQQEQQQQQQSTGKPIVHIIAPSGKDNNASMASISEEVAQIRNYVIKHGLVPILHDDVFSTYDVEPIYANTDLYRATDLIEALTDSSSIVWCIRGGEGVARLIPYLETTLPNHLPVAKLVIGFSDITVLHTYLIKRYGWSTIYGGMLSQIVNDELDEDSVQHLWDIIFQRKQEFEYNLVCLNPVCKGQSSTETQLASSVVGGTLTLVQNSIGTVWQIETAGKLVLLEDVNEAPYRTERMLDHLIQAGIFANASGVILAEFPASRDEKLNTFILQRFADSQTHLPVYRLHGVGHGRRNLPMPFNTKARIEDVSDVDRRLVVEIPKIRTT